MIWRVVSRYAELAGRSPVVSGPVAYGMLDGLFQQALLAYGDDASTLDHLTTRVRADMPLLLST